MKFIKTSLVVASLIVCFSIQAQDKTKLSKAENFFAKFPEELAHNQEHVCFECYDENRNKLNRLLKEFSSINNSYADGSINPSTLEDYEHDDNFLVSRIGILIHKECAAPDRFSKGFNVEKAIVDSFVETFDKLLEAESWAREDGRPENAIIKSHIPRLLHFFDREVWGKNNGQVDAYINQDTIINGSTDPCRDFGNLVRGGVQSIEGKTCNFNTDVERYRPKIFCNRDHLSEASQDFEAVDGTAAASRLGNPGLIMKESDGHIEVYNGNYIMFNEDKTENITELGFKATAMHEFWHNLGYGDRGESIAYGYGCLPLIFQKDAGYTDYATNVDSGNAVSGSYGACITTDPRSPAAMNAGSRGSDFINRIDGIKSTPILLLE